MSADWRKKNAASVSAQLESENRLMEDRLKQLKLSLQEQKTQRSAKKKTAGGVIWRSAQVGDKTGKGAAKGSGDRRKTGKTGRTAKPLGNSNQAPGSPRMVPRPPQRGTAAEQPSAVAVAAAPSVKSPVRDMVELSGDPESDEPAPEDGAEFDEDGSHESFLSALQDWRKGPSRPASSAGAGAGAAEPIATQAGGDSSSLMDGPAFNEAAAAAEFQAALAAWRGAPAEPAAAAAAPAKPVASAPKMWCPPADPVELLAGGCQTEKAATSPASVPTFKTKSKLSYMERIMLKRSKQSNGMISHPIASRPKKTKAPEVDYELADSLDDADYSDRGPPCFDWPGSAAEGGAELPDAAPSIEGYGLIISEIDDDEAAGLSSEDNAEQPMVEEPETATELQQQLSWARRASGEGADSRASEASDAATPTDFTARASDNRPGTARVLAITPFDPSDEMDSENVAPVPVPATIECATLQPVVGSPHRLVVTPGLMHDFEEMEKGVGVVGL